MTKHSKSRLKPLPEKPGCRKCAVTLTTYNAVPDYIKKRDLICKRCDRDTQRKSWRLRKYGVRQEDYDWLLEFQGRKCAICRLPFSEYALKIDIDHCHDSGFVRGLLCPHCNKGLGAFRDNRHFLANAIRYLQHNHSPEKQPAKVLR